MAASVSLGSVTAYGSFDISRMLSNISKAKTALADYEQFVMKIQASIGTGFTLGRGGGSGGGSGGGGNAGVDAFTRAHLDAQRAMQTSRSELGKTELSLAKYKLAAAKADLKEFNEAHPKAVANVERLGSVMGNMLPQFIKYRILSEVFSQVTRSVEAAADAFLDLEKGAARVQRVLGKESRPQVTQAIAAGASRYGLTEGQVVESTYQIASFQKDPKIALRELDSVLQLVTGTESDARETARLLTQMYNLFGNQIKDTTDEAEKFRRMGELVAIAWKNTQTEVPELVQSFKYLGAAASVAGVPIEQLTGVLGLLDYVGQRSTTSGTGLRNALVNIFKHATDTEGAMRKLYVQTKDGGLDLIKTLTNIGQAFEIVLKQKGQLAAEAFIHSLFPDVRGAQQVKSFIEAIKLIGDTLGKDLMDGLNKGITGKTAESGKIAKDAMDNVGDQMKKTWRTILDSMALSFGDMFRKLHGEGFLYDMQRGNDFRIASREDEAQRAQIYQESTGRKRAEFDLNLLQFARARKMTGGAFRGDTNAPTDIEDIGLLPHQVSALQRLTGSNPGFWTSAAQIDKAIKEAQARLQVPEFGANSKGAVGGSANLLFSQLRPKPIPISAAAMAAAAMETPEQKAAREKAQKAELDMWKEREETAKRDRDALIKQFNAGGMTDKVFGQRAAAIAGGLTLAQKNIARLEKDKGTLYGISKYGDTAGAQFMEQVGDLTEKQRDELGKKREEYLTLQIDLIDTLIDRGKAFLEAAKEGKGPWAGDVTGLAGILDRAAVDKANLQKRFGDAAGIGFGTAGEVAKIQEQIKKARVNLDKITDEFGAREREAQTDYQQQIRGGIPEDVAYRTRQETLRQIARDREAPGRKLRDEVGKARTEEIQQQYSDAFDKEQELKEATDERFKASLIALANFASDVTDREEKIKEFEFATNKITAEDYINWLKERMVAYDIYSDQWISASEKIFNIQKQQQKADDKDWRKTFRFLPDLFEEIGHEAGSTFTKGLQKALGNTFFGRALARTLQREVDDLMDNLTQQIFRKAKGAAGGKAAGGAGNLFGMFESSILGAGVNAITGGLFSFIPSLFGGGGGGGGGIGGILGGITGALGFDNPVNDRMANRFGFDFGRHFSNGAKDGISPVGRATHSTVVHAPVTIHATVSSDVDIPRLASEVAWHVRTRLPMVTARA